LSINFKYSGDKYNANRLKFFGLRQLEILKSAMRFQGLQQNRRLVKFSSGVSVLCTSVIGIDTIDIYVPPLFPVGGKGVITEEEYCWCTTYFTEGTILGVINSDAMEGEYPNETNHENNYFYYHDMFNSETEHEDKFNGIMYNVEICRGTKKEVVTCSSTDFTKYTEGMKVILFCVGDYVSPKRKYPFPEALAEPKGCPGKSGKCYACSALLKSKEEAPILEGTYVLVPLTFEEATGDANLLQVTPSDLEKGEVYKSAVNDLKDIDFENNTIETGWGTASIHINSQEPFEFKDGCRVVALAKAGCLKDKTSLLIVNCANDYYCLGHIFNTPARCLSDCLKFSTYVNALLWDTSKDKEIIFDPDKKYVTVFGNYYIFAIFIPKAVYVITTDTEESSSADGITTIIRNKVTEITIDQAKRGSLTKDLDSSYTGTEIVDDIEKIGHIPDSVSSRTYSATKTILPTSFCFISYLGDYISPTPIAFIDKLHTITSSSTHGANNASIVTGDVHNHYDRDSSLIFTMNRSLTVSYGDPSGIPNISESGTNLITEQDTIIVSTYQSNIVYFVDFYLTLGFTRSGYGTGTNWDTIPNAHVVIYKKEDITNLSSFSFMDCEKITSGALIDALKEFLINNYLHGDFGVSGNLQLLINSAD